MHISKLQGVLVIFLVSIWLVAASDLMVSIKLDCKSESAIRETWCTKITATEETVESFSSKVIRMLSSGMPSPFMTVNACTNGDEYVFPPTLFSNQTDSFLVFKIVHNCTSVCKCASIEINPKNYEFEAYDLNLAVNLRSAKTNDRVHRCTDFEKKLWKFKNADKDVTEIEEDLPIEKCF